MNLIKYHDRECQNRMVNFYTSLIIKGVGENRSENSKAYHDRPIPYSRTDYHRFIFFPRTTRDWNQLPESLVTSPSAASFKKALQNFQCLTRKDESSPHTHPCRSLQIEVDIIRKKQKKEKNPKQ